MTVDVNVLRADDAFLDDIDEIMEETMVEMFILQPRNTEELDTAKKHAKGFNPIFYCAPLMLKAETDDNCIGFFVESAQSLADNEGIEKPLFIDETLLDEAFSAKLISKGYRGIILNATKTHDNMENFFIALGAQNIDAFDLEQLAKVSMKSIVLQSTYPEFGFEEISTAVKRISDIIFRPDQSIIAEATKNALILFGFKKA